MKGIILEHAPIEEFLLNFSIAVSKCDMRDTIFFDREFLDDLRHIAFISPNCDRDSSYLCIECGKCVEAQIRLKNGFQLNFIYYAKDVPNNMFRLKELGNNKEPFSYHDLRYPYIDYKNPKNNSGEYYQMKICQ